MKAALLILSFIITMTAYTQGWVWVEQVSNVNTRLNSVEISNWIGAAWICGNNGVVLRTSNNGSNWLNIGVNGIPADVNLHCISQGYDYGDAITAGVRSDTAIVYRTTNSGTSWHAVLKQFGGRFNGINIKSQNGFICGNPVGGRWSIWKTTNRGLNWDSTGLYVSQNNSETGWANSFKYFYGSIAFGTNNSRMYYSINDGLNWSYMTTSALGENNITSLSFVSYTYQMYAYLGTTSKVLFTTNFGANWSQTTPLNSGNVVGLANRPLPVDLIGQEELFIVRPDNKIQFQSPGSTDWSVIYTAPSGNYTHITNNMPFEHYAVRDNGGISYCNCIIIGISPISNYIPDVFSLSQNYPNPFNPTTDIRFDIPVGNGRDRLVKLIIYDALGREVSQLVNQQLQPGTYSVDWDASNFPSGVYFYTLTTENYSESKKMLMVK
ncbi:MAG: T9SS type A sorting domain-containing protein [Ignavibacteria bacterium]|nr:T9SS type A sorting domain-containing protein [Ignavibacteria bacterium]